MGNEVTGLSSLHQYLIGVVIIGIMMILIIRKDKDLSRRAKILGTGFFAILWPIVLVLAVVFFVSAIVKGWKEAETDKEGEEHDPN